MSDDARLERMESDFDKAGGAIVAPLKGSY